MRNSPYLFAAAAVLLAGIPAAAAEGPRPDAAKALPPNTIYCADWTHNSDGSWSAHRGARPFDLGTAKRLNMQDTRIHAHDINFGGYDLVEVLDEKCGAI
jgi:hypothetical protein